MVIFVANVVLYLMAKQNVALAKADVELCDVANVYCEDETIRAKVEAIKVHRFRHEGEPRVVVSVLKIIEQITKLCPGVTVESIGETDIIIQKASLEHDKPEQKYSPWAYIKIAIVALICFFGSAFTIMAFHNDVGLADVLSVFPIKGSLGSSPNLLLTGLLVVIGVFAGIFVGCLSIALSEVLDGIPIFARRIRLKMGVSIAVLMVAVGKIAGSIVYFINGFFEGI